MLLSWLLIALANVNDRFRIDHESGVWMALARYFAHGTLYPPLFDHGFYGGTRYMPLQIAIDGGFARLTGEELVSGKVVAYVVTAALLTLMIVALRRLECPTPVAVALTALLLVTEPGILAATSIYGDALPVTLQLAALLLILRDPKPWWAALAGVLCALAWLSKLSAVWAAAAIVIWLLPHHRRSAIVFSACVVLVAVLGATGFDALSHGRMIDNLRPGYLGTNGVDNSPQKLLQLLETFAPAVWPLLGIALFAVGTRIVRRRRPTLYQLALVLCAVVLFLALADPGADWNHLLDLEVLTLLVVGEYWAAAGSGRQAPAVQAVLAALVAWLLVSSYAATMAGPTRAAIHSLAGGRRDSQITKYPLRGLVTRNDSLLSEDPSVPVLLDERPVVTDPFVLLRLDRKHPTWTDALIRRLDRKEFTKVVLLKELDLADPWWRTNHFGPRIVRAIARNYHLAARVGYTYWVYEPRVGGS